MGLYVPRNTKEKVKGRLGWDLNLDAAFLPNHPLIYSALPVTWPCAFGLPISLVGQFQWPQFHSDVYWSAAYECLLVKRELGPICDC